MRRSAFSLTEVLFAIIILGIGFIMIAAMFPVSISQSRLTVEETQAASIARSAMAETTRLAENGDSPPTTPPPPTWGQLFPPTDLYRTPPTVTGLSNPPFKVKKHSQVTIPGKVLSFADPRLDNGTVKYRSNLWAAFKRSLVMPTDNRFAWVPLYRRDVTYFNNTEGDIDSASGIGQLTALQSPFAQVYFIPVAVRNRTQYDTTSANSIDTDPVNPADTNLIPRLVQIEIVANNSTAGGYILRFLNNNTAGSHPSDSAVEGAFVVISDDRITGPLIAPDPTDPTFKANVNQGRMNGHIYRLGVRRPDLDGTQAGGKTLTAWELTPGGSFVPDPGADGQTGTADDITSLGTGPLGANAFIIGRNTTPSSTTPGSTGYEGAAQDVAAYVTFIKVN